MIVTGATPGAFVAFAYSLTGIGPTPVPSFCTGLIINLSNPIKRLGSLTANANGEVTFTQNVPGSAALLQINVQALDFTSCLTSNVVTAFIQ